MKPLPPDSRRAGIVQAFEPAAPVVTVTFPSAVDEVLPGPSWPGFPTRLDTPRSRFQ